MTGNRFKDPLLRRAFDDCVTGFNDLESEFYFEGEQHRGALHRCAFWDGFNGLDPSPHGDVRGTPAYACRRAGEQCAKTAKMTSFGVN